MIAIDMKMPDNCVECRFGQGDYWYCYAMPPNFCGHIYDIEDDGKPDWCPLKNVDIFRVDRIITDEELSRYGRNIVMGYTMKDISRKIYDGMVDSKHIIIEEKRDSKLYPEATRVRATMYVVDIVNDRKGE